MASLTISFRERSRWLNYNLPDHCCEINTTILGEIQGFDRVGNEETDLQGCYPEKRHS
jgi:hypothetical protein